MDEDPITDLPLESSPSPGDIFNLAAEFENMQETSSTTFSEGLNE